MHSKDEPSLANLWRETHGCSGAVQVFMAKLAELGSGSGGAGGPNEDEHQVLMHPLSIEGVGCFQSAVSDKPAAFRCW